jgi:hypothetical protein
VDEFTFTLQETCLKDIHKSSFRPSGEVIEDEPKYLKGTQVLELVVSVRLRNGLDETNKRELSSCNVPKIAHHFSISQGSERIECIYLNIGPQTIKYGIYFGSEGHLKVSLESGRSVGRVVIRVRLTIKWCFSPIMRACDFVFRDLAWIRIGSNDTPL